MAAPTLTDPPSPAPNRSMTPAAFSAAADAHTAWQPVNVSEMRTALTFIDGAATAASTAATTAATQATNAATSAANASTSATTASNWAIKTGSVVSGSDWSAKEHAVGTAVTTGSAKDWATKTSGTVAGTDYSAKYYSQVAQTAAAAAQSAAGLPSLTGNAGKVLTVNSTSNGVTWATAGAGSAIGDTLTTAVTMSTPTWLPCDGAVYLKSSYTPLSTLLGSLLSQTPWTSVAGGNFYSGVTGNMVVSANGTLITNDAPDSSVRTSTDGGTSWGTVTATKNATLFSANASGVVIGVAKESGTSNQTVGTRSTDNASTWSNTGTFAGIQPTAMAMQGNLVVMVGGINSSGLTATTTCRVSSNAGQTWSTSGSMGSAAVWCGVVIDPLSTTFFAFGAAGNVVYSANNGVSWTTASPTGITLLTDGTCAAIGNGVLVVVGGGDPASGNNVAYSTNYGVSWTAGKLPASVFPKPSILFVPSIGFVISGASGGAIYVSADGKGNWQTYTGENTNKTYGALAFLNNKLIAQPYAGGTYTSSIFNPYGYDTTTSFATPIINPSTNGGAKTYIRANT